MYSDKIVEMIVRQHNAQKIGIKRIKLKHIHKEIIELKQENRNIGDKIRSYKLTISYNYNKMFTCSQNTELFTYLDRVKRDNKTIEYLEKLQKLNSKLINKHRAKQRELRSELQELQKSLYKLAGDVL